MQRIPFLTELDPDTKLRVKGAIPGWALSRVRPNAIRTVRAQGAAPHHPDTPIFAILSTWMEHDIVYAAVRHALKQGVERVFLLDNDSPDHTVAEAVAAGASHVLTFTTDSFDEVFKYELVNLEIERISRASGRKAIWWLVMDADEFVSAPDGMLLPEFLATVDVRARVVGARVFDHFPSPGSEYAAHSDPLETQPMCREKFDHRCELRHHKHPLFYWDRARRPIVVEPGFHQVACKGEALYEPPRSLILHHYPYRNEADARHRLSALMERGVTEDTRRADADGHMRARFESLDAVYKGDYDHVIDYRTGLPGITVSDWYETDAFMTGD